GPGISALRRRRPTPCAAAQERRRRARAIGDRGGRLVPGEGRTSRPARPALGRLCRIRGSERLRRGLLSPVRVDDGCKRPLRGNVQAVSPDWLWDEYTDRVD